MAEVKVIATLNDTDYELTEENNVYSEEIVAPNQSTEISVMAIAESGEYSVRTANLYVNMDWLPPKTDWTAQDYVNTVDYNRIIGNIAYLKAYLDSLFLGLTNVSLGEEKAEKSLIYAREINAIEVALETLNLETYKFDIGETKEYMANRRTLDFNELNRIESAILLLYQTMVIHKENLPRLAFTLGSQKGIKV